ncbi:MAG: FAD:protein FMN transferase [Bacteroidales bacterium]|nr:FAD:protein FMN transferase [Candidatus Physcousia equi]
MILKEKPWLWRIPFLVLLVVGSVWAIKKNRTQAEKGVWQSAEGTVFGTVYHATYQSDKDLHSELLAALDSVDASLSMFNPQSTVSLINSNKSDSADSLFTHVFTLAQKVSGKTGGAFDVTVAPLVNAWGFGFKNGTLPDSLQVDSILQYVGWQRVALQEGRVVKDDPNIVMDFSAIAKGFGCDRVAEVFRRHGVQNFMIEIGGEVVVQGKNKKGEPWRVGVNKPVDDASSSSTELEEVLSLTDCAMATSGNYRNFYTTDDGRRVAHTIDPHTGYPVQHSLLSATVFAPTCAEADAFATSFMVLGLEGAKEVLKQQRQLKVFLIYADGKENKVYRTIE